PPRRSYFFGKIVWFFFFGVGGVFVYSCISPPPTPNLPAPLKDFDLIEPPMKALQKTKPVKEFLQRAIILAKSSAGTNSRRAASPISFTLP
ncbi:hypothetical protein, partial [uncultured Bilophila sp.]|uniref:hypothetical protein n=1 Tax=uncultured Bilophila sp. TaxID=529385 RepID=UPI002599C28A